jgi:NADPH:quinone reductase-like Zn-dependent oxidoreductase
MWLPFRVFVGFTRPRHPILGLEFSGEVEAVGADVIRFRPGDQVFGFTGRHFGAYAEYVCARDGGQYFPYECVMAHKPMNVTHAEAAIAPTRGTLALYFLEQVEIQSGEKVLVYGASGGIGTFAVQIAKHLGAEVTAVCSTANIELVRSLGADRVLDYSVQNDTDVGRHDVFFDAVGHAKDSALKSRCLSGLTTRGRVISVDRSAKVPAAHLHTLKELIDAGRVRPVLDRVYPLAQAAEAQRYVEGGHKRGGVAITVTDHA